MKTVKILSLTLLMSVFCVGMTFAQQDQKATQPSTQKAHKAVQANAQKVKETAEERATKQVDKMKTTLNLTPDQVTRMQGVQTQFVKDQEALAAKKGTGTAATKAADMKAKREAYDSQVKSILTPDQYTKYQEQCKNAKKGVAKKGTKAANQAASVKPKVVKKVDAAPAPQK